MIPLRDSIRPRTFPFVNYLLLAANAAAFWVELGQGRRIEAFLLHWGLVPARFSAPGAVALERVPDLAAPLVTSMFLHGSWLHLLSNAWTLFIFGDNVEDRMGHVRYFFFYLLCGLAAAAAQVWASWGASAPMIGASGAIAGVMGAYFLLFPKARVVTLVPVFFVPHKTEVSAYVFLGAWFISQLYFGSVLSGQAEGVAWWAHVGGFAAGLALLPGFARRRR